MLPNVKLLLKISPSLSKFLQMKINSFLFRLLPFAVSRFYLSLLGRLYYFFNPRERGLIRQTISHVFRRKMAGKLLKGKIRQTFQGIFDHYHEKLFVAYYPYTWLERFLRNKVGFRGEDHLKAALEEGKGVILVTGHFGAVEFLPAVLALNNYPATMICRFQTNRLRESLCQRAERVGLTLIDADGENIMLVALKALKQGHILITECDEFDEWRPDRDRYTYFLNSRLALDRSLELLRKRSGAPVVSVLMKRDGKQNYTLDLTLIADGQTPAHLPVGLECLRTLEAAVEAQPEQWYQWKKFGKLIESRLEVENDRRESGYLAPEIGVSLADQA
jgi:lauroyl/myristoyl acyltransferase